jgi:small subunit ribosomal protein S7
LGGTSQQIPAALDKKKKKSTSIRALIQIATEKQKKSAQRKDIKLASTFAHSLANELYEASQGLGSALQKRDELHKLAESNRALLTQRWW